MHACISERLTWPRITIRKVNGAISYNWLAPAGATILSSLPERASAIRPLQVTFDNSFVSGTISRYNPSLRQYSTAQPVIYRNADRPDQRPDQCIAPFMGIGV